MGNIDWTPVTTALVALIATLITTFVPMIIKLFFEAQAVRLTNAKKVVESNQKIVEDIVTVIQQTMNALSNSDKYNLALGRATAALHLPEGTLQQMIELAVATAKMEWGKDWDAIGGDKVSTVPIIGVPPLDTTTTPPSQLNGTTPLANVPANDSNAPNH